MKLAIFQVVVAVSMLCLVAGDNGGVPPGPSGLNGSTTVIPSTEPTKSSTTSTTTTTTMKPEPTSPPPNSTTTSTTTTTTPKTTTTTTTVKPTTASTTTASTTTAKPTTPAPVDPVQGKWIANYTKTNNTCLVLEAAIQVDVPWKEGNTTKTYKFNVPPTAQSQGSCDNNTEMITLFFGEANIVSFNFTKNNSKFDLDSVMVRVNVTTANGSQVITIWHDKDEFATPVTRSYKCAKEQTLNLTAKLPDIYEGQLRVSHLQMQAFRNATNSKFDEALDCAGSETPDVVPIAVGCALAALVIIVLVAYLIGRRRSQARGYLSM